VSNNGVTVKSVLVAVQGHSKWYHSEACLGVVSYSHSIVTMAVSYIVSKKKRDIGRKSRFLPRDACIKRGLSHHAVSVCVCVCVCLSRSYILLKLVNISSDFFHHRVNPSF